MSILVWMDFRPGVKKAIKSEVTYEATSNSYIAYKMIYHAKFIGTEGTATSLAGAQESCERFYRAMMGLPQEDPQPKPPQFVSTLPHHERPLPGVNVVDPTYRMSRINSWRRAESTWAALLNSRVNAPKPELKYYLNDPSYDWYRDYSLDPNNLPTRPNGAI